MKEKIEDSNILVTYYVRWRHIPAYLDFTPLMMISVDHTTVEAKQWANEWDIAIAVSKEFEAIGIYPERIRIESFDVMQ